MFLLKYFLLLFLSFKEINGDYCLTNDDNPYLYFSTKTPYEFVRGSAGSETECTPIQMWILSRHGTRFGDASTLRDMKKSIKLQSNLFKHYKAGVLSENRGLCTSDLMALKNWVWDESIEKLPNYLNDQGWNDLFLLASRYKKRYPSILQIPYTPNNFYFRHTSTQRTEYSCKAFIDGLFGNGSYKHIRIEKPLDFDEILNPFDSCDLWSRIVDSVERKTEKKAFRNTDVFQKLLEDVSKRMGYNKILKYSDIHSMYNNCRFDKSRHVNNISAWCSVFTKKELLLMEYYEDLDRYYKVSYGQIINKKLGCMPLKHLMETFEMTIINNGTVEGPKLVAMFSHDTMLDMMYTAMDYAHDRKPLSGTDFEDFLVNRKYRTSTNTPFAGNIVAILHDCLNIDDQRFKVQFFINERPMELNGCSRGLCSWEHLVQFFPDYEDCNLDFCDYLF